MEKKIDKNDTLGFLQARLFFLENGGVENGVIIMGDDVIKLNEYANPIGDNWPWCYDEETNIIGQILRKQNEKRKLNKSKQGDNK